MDPGKKLLALAEDLPVETFRKQRQQQQLTVQGRVPNRYSLYRVPILFPSGGENPRPRSE